MRAVLVVMLGLVLGGCAMCESDDAKTDGAMKSTSTPSAAATGPGAAATATSVQPEKPAAKPAFPISDAMVETMVSALNGAPEDMKSEAACAVIAEAPRLYGPDIARGCRKLAATPPASQSMVLADALQAPVAELGCEGVFRRMGTVPPNQRLALFASGCPMEGSGLKDAQLAKAPPTGGMVAIVLNGLAQRRGFVDHKLHQAVIAAFLTPVAPDAPAKQ